MQICTLYMHIPTHMHPFFQQHPFKSSLNTIFNLARFCLSPLTGKLFQNCKSERSLTFTTLSSHSMNPFLLTEEDHIEGQSDKIRAKTYLGRGGECLVTQHFISKFMATNEIILCLIKIIMLKRHVVFSCGWTPLTFKFSLEFSIFHFLSISGTVSSVC